MKIITKFKIILYVFSMLYYNPVLSNTHNECGSSGYLIAYFNGIDNSFLDAGRSIVRLYDIYGRTYSNGEKIRYRRFYNATHGLLSDAREVFKQSIQENSSLKWELFIELVTGGNTITREIITLFPEAESVIGTLREQIIEIAKNNIANTTTRGNYQETINNMREIADGYILERSKILMVAHSQGNFFANSIYDYISGKYNTDSIKVVHVATPAETLKGQYVTVDKDLIINALRIINNVPNHNTNVPITVYSSDIKGHSFLDVYMNTAYPAYAEIKRHMDSALSSLENPNTEGNPGLFTVRLTWNGSGDVDLHVFEPDNTHVFYGNTNGNTGELDVDNTVANGPEHYFASCDDSSIQEGAYRVGINNFSEATGRTAKVLLLTTERSYNPISLSVGSERGSDGDDSPISVFNVVVTRQDNGLFTAVRQ